VVVSTPRKPFRIAYVGAPEAVEIALRPCEDEALWAVSLSRRRHASTNDNVPSLVSS
jgi:hypothetical protein